MLSSLLNLSGAVFLSNIPKITRFKKQRETTATSQKIASYGWNYMACKNLAFLWGNVYQQGSSKVKGEIVAYAKGRTDVTANEKHHHYHAAGKKKSIIIWFSIIFISGIIPFSGCTISRTFLATTEIWIRKNLLSMLRSWIHIENSNCFPGSDKRADYAAE